jgi:hypothetical protein
MNEGYQGVPAMNRKFSAIGFITLALGLATFLWLLYHVYEVRADLPGVLNFDVSDYRGYITGLGYLIMLFFHAAAFVFLFLHSRFIKRYTFRSVAAFVLGILSLFAIAVEKVMYDEIAREMTVEYPVPGEVFFLYLCFGVNALFCLVMVGAVYRALAENPSSGGVSPSKDVRLFTLAQVMGIVSGVMGMMLTFSLMAGRRPPERFWVFIPFYLLFLLPYGLAIFSWLIVTWRERLADRYDEKQVQDILKASFTTLVLSIPGMFILALMHPSGYYWFPYYLFLILLLFSASTLYYFTWE